MALYIATVRNGGSGYQVGDVLTAGVGNSSLGRNLRVVVGLPLHMMSLQLVLFKETSL